MKRCAVVLVNYADYAGKHLAECYQSLMKQTYPKSHWSLFVVDNASMPETREQLSSLAPEARVITTSANQGWSGGNNRGIETALREGFDAVVCLNMDTIVDADWLKTLAEDAERPDIHILQSKIFIYGTDLINSLGNRIHFLGYGSCNGYKKKDTGRRYPLDFASGASMLVKREVFEKIGPFRENYFMYGEDLEFCWRARLAGFCVDLSERSVCHHKYDYRKILNHAEWTERNRIRTLYTLEKPASLVLILLPKVLVEMFVLLYFLIKGNFKKIMQLLRFYAMPASWSEIRAARLEVSRFRVCRDREVIGRFSSELAMEEGNGWIRIFIKFLANPLLWLYWRAVRWIIIW